MSRTERIYWIESEIKRGRYPNADSVVEQFGVSKRTAFEDAKHLRINCNGPLVFDRARNGWYYSSETFSLPFLALDEREASALRRSLLVAREYLAPTDAEAVARVADLLAPYLSPGRTTGHDQITGAVHLSAIISSSLVSDCDAAVSKRQRLRILYYSPRSDELTERVIQPYDLLVWRGEPHLVGFCELRQGIRQFFLGRVREWSLLPGDAAFVRDPSFDIADYAGRGLDMLHGEELTRVRVKFTPHQARWVRERRYHPSQELEETADGGLALTIEVAGLEEVKRWIMSFGKDAEAIEPPELREAIVRDLKILQETYAGGEE